jgi:hypothetical protein
MLPDKSIGVRTMPRLRKPKPAQETTSSRAAEIQHGHFHTDRYQTMPASFARFVERRGLKGRLVKPTSPATKH